MITIDVCYNQIDMARIQVSLSELDTMVNIGDLDVEKNTIKSHTITGIARWKDGTDFSKRNTEIGIRIAFNRAIEHAESFYTLEEIDIIKKKFEKNVGFAVVKLGAMSYDKEKAEEILIAYKEKKKKDKETRKLKYDKIKFESLNNYYNEQDSYSEQEQENLSL